MRASDAAAQGARGAPEAAAASARLAATTPRIGTRRRTALLDDLDLQPCRRLGHLAGDRSRALLRVAPEHVGLLRREALAGALLRLQPPDVRPERVELAL